MPFKSQAQRAKFAELVKDGKMEQATFDNWQKETGDAKLPKKLPQKSTSTGMIRRPRRLK